MAELWRSVHVEGIAWWSAAWPDWSCAAPAMRGEPAAADTATRSPPARPNPSLLAANEKRRAPDSVLLALEVAAASCADSGRNPASLSSVFSSAHGDLPITDALCRTLAADPLLLSPTRFHHSVHNAASGYWAIATGCRAASSALSAHEHSFAAALLEAAVICAAEAQPVLLIVYDTEAVGALRSVNASRGMLGLGLVLSPEKTAAARWSMRWKMGSDTRSDTRSGTPALPPALRSAAALSLAANGSADGLPLFEALARGAPQALTLPLGPHCHMALDLVPLSSAASDPADAAAA